MRSRRGEGLFVATPSDVVRTWSVQVFAALLPFNPYPGILRTREILVRLPSLTALPWYRARGEPGYNNQTEFSRLISHQTVFFSHNKSAVSTFQPAYKLKRTGPQLPSSNITKAVCIKCSGRHLTKDLDVITLLTSCIFICMP
ncbi:hypothetical protein SEVIR_2G165320v4 [Setaria viridis]